VLLLLSHDNWQGLAMFTWAGNVKLSIEGEEKDLLSKIFDDEDQQAGEKGEIGGEE
jgi:hypothetical protein